MSTNERDSKLISDPDDVRFEFFTQNIIPDILRSTGTRCEQPWEFCADVFFVLFFWVGWVSGGQRDLDNSGTDAQRVVVFIPSYFDFVRVRNWFRREKLSYTGLSEYTPSSAVSRARTRFFHGERQFLLVSERFHFYHRYRLRGATHAIFYSPPLYGSAYPEIVSVLGDVPGKDADSSVPSAVVLFHQRTDRLLMPAVVGQKRARKLFDPAAPEVHMFCWERPPVGSKGEEGTWRLFHNSTGSVHKKLLQKLIDEFCFWQKTRGAVERQALISLSPPPLSLSHTRSDLRSTKRTG
jgi:Utp25, C-terminal domain